MYPRSPSVIAYFDVDCFYAQDEVLRRPHLQDRPVGVTQKFLVVTCNYVARNLGVPKMASIQLAKQRCPDLVLINGEDLTPYRASSKKIMAVLSRFGILERRGLDEAALDISTEVLKRGASMPRLKDFVGHVIGGKDKAEGGMGVSDFRSIDPCGNDYMLLVGSHVVAEIRASVQKETGFMCSSGTASNKMLAKLASSVNKPNNQTCMLDSGVAAFLEPLTVRMIPGIGHQTESLLKDMGISTIAELKNCGVKELSSKFGDRLAILLHGYCRGIENSPVQDKGAPKSLSVEDSFQPCTSINCAQEIVRRLAPDLIARLDEDKEEYCRSPKVFTIKLRYRGSWAFKSASTAMPMEILSSSLPQEKRAEMVVGVAMKLLMHSFGRQSFGFVVLNIGATNFFASSGHNVAASHDIRSFLHSHGQAPKQNTKGTLSKREERMEREKGLLQDVQPTWVHDETKASKGILSLDLQKSTSLASQMELQNHGFDFQDGSANDEYLWEVNSLGYPLSSVGGSLDESEHGVMIASMDGVCVGVASSNLNTGQSKDVYNKQTGQSDCSEPPSREVDLNSSFCKKCGHELSGDAQSRQEHNDYHFALELNSDEQRQADIFGSSSSKQVFRAKKRVDRSSPQSRSKKTKAPNGTLDCYLLRPKG